MIDFLYYSTSFNFILFDSKYSWTILVVLTPYSLIFSIEYPSHSLRLLTLQCYNAFSFQTHLLFDPSSFQCSIYFTTLLFWLYWSCIVSLSIYENELLWLITHFWYLHFWFTYAYFTFDLRLSLDLSWYSSQAISSIIWLSLSSVLNPYWFLDPLVFFHASVFHFRTSSLRFRWSFHSAVRFWDWFYSTALLNALLYFSTSQHYSLSRTFPIWLWR